MCIYMLARVARVAPHLRRTARGCASSVVQAVPANAATPGSQLPQVQATIPLPDTVPPDAAIVRAAATTPAGAEATTAPPAEMLVHGPLTLEQMAQPTADIAIRTVPVPVLVGPPDAALATVPPAGGADGGVALDVLTGSGAPVAATVAAKPATAGGWFFARPMAGLEWVLTTVHDTTGLPWWATLAATTVSVRLLITPFQIYQSKNIAKMAAIKPQVPEGPSNLGWPALILRWALSDGQTELKETKPN